MSISVGTGTGYNPFQRGTSLQKRIYPDPKNIELCLVFLLRMFPTSRATVNGTGICSPSHEGSSPKVFFAGSTVSFPSAISMTRQSCPLVIKTTPRYAPIRLQKIHRASLPFPGNHIKDWHLSLIMYHGEVASKIAAGACCCDNTSPSIRINRCSSICLHTSSRSVPQLVKMDVRSRISRIFIHSISPYSTAIAATWFARTSAAFLWGTTHSISFDLAFFAMTRDSSRSSKPVQELSRETVFPAGDRHDLSVAQAVQLPGESQTGSHGQPSLYRFPASIDEVQMSVPDLTALEPFFGIDSHLF